MEREYIKDFYGRIIGAYETDSYGKVILKDFYGHILGSYDPRDNITRDFYGHKIGHGNVLARLLKN